MTMREISPAENMSTDDFLEIAGDYEKSIAKKIRKEKVNGERPLPSTKLIDSSKILNQSIRKTLLDKVATLVDENLFGRSEMCLQFANLLQQSLCLFGLSARAVIGEAIYYANSCEVFRWDHAWVRINEEVIDANVDSLYENPAVPDTVKIAPYWGPIKLTPNDRKLKEKHGVKLPPDTDVSDIWWPDLEQWIKSQYASSIESGKGE